ncbi:DinB family protein [Rhodanobacter hydrolyticus]
MTMSLKNQFELMAGYNRWMNDKLYAAASRLDAAAMHEDRGAFFGSVFGTLNHLLVADTIWLKRFADHPAVFRSLDRVRGLPHPYSLAEVLYPEFDPLREARRDMDETIVRLCAEATNDAYDQALTYSNRSGQVFVRKFGHLMQHFFNHQTHHRGQVTTLLSQSGIDVGVTDLSAMLPEAD